MCEHDMPAFLVLTVDGGAEFLSQIHAVHDSGSAA